MRQCLQSMLDPHRRMAACEMGSPVVSLVMLLQLYLQVTNTAAALLVGPAPRLVVRLAQPSLTALILLRLSLQPRHGKSPQ